MAHAGQESDRRIAGSPASLKARMAVADWGRWIYGIARLVARRFVEDQGLPNAASLTYTTLLSLVPLMTVSLAVFAAFPVADRLAEQLQAFLFENFMPTSGEQLQAYLQEFSSKASRLTGAGFVFLLIIALMMMANIDRAFSTIWRVRRKRGPLAMFMVYWSIISLGPLLIGASLAVTSYLVSIPFFSDAAASLGAGRRLLGLTPLLASTIAFTLLYVIVPNRKVSLRHALAGGFFAALMFEGAKRGFALYITHFPTYEAIYGALAVIPIFLIWVYLSWSITLLGAEFAYCLGIYSYRWQQRHQDQWGLMLAFRLLRYLRKRQQLGESASIESLSRGLDKVPLEQLETLLMELQQGHLVLRTDEGHWALGRDLSQVTLLELYRLRPLVPGGKKMDVRPDEASEVAMAGALEKAMAGLSSALDLPLERLYAQGGQDPSPGAQAVSGQTS